ncbi:MAG: alpha/beta hydrolase [Gammaproteobacteria bacterium]|jgi:putative redox protein|nr:alpha/beta hydrolase [Gammaproteobacteria bacterium]
MSRRRSLHTRFKGSHGHLLDGRVDLPEQGVEPRLFALFAHCFTCNKQYLAISRISQALARHGIAVLRFDFTGLGASQGDFSKTSFSSNVEDVLAAAEYLRRHHRAPGVLIGHSLGGAAVLVAAPAIPESQVVVTIAAPSRPGQILDHLAHVADTIEQTGSAPVAIGNETYTLRREFLQDVAGYELEPGIRALDRALLVFQSPADPVVPRHHGERLVAWASHPKALIELDGADHLLTSRDDAQLVADMTAAWASRYATAGWGAEGTERRRGQGSAGQQTVSLSR